MTPSLIKLPQEFERERVQKVIKEVLEDEYVTARIGNEYQIWENIEKKKHTHWLQLEIDIQGL